MSTIYKDILYEVRDGVVRITINRPEVYNAFRLQTLEELIDAFQQAGEEKSANVIVFAGAGDKAFCTGGDQKEHLSEDGLYGPRGTVGDSGRPRPRAISPVGNLCHSFLQHFLCNATALECISQFARCVLIELHLIPAQSLANIALQ